MLPTGSNFTIHCLGILSTIVVNNEVHVRCTDKVLIDNQTVPISTTEIPSTPEIDQLGACGPNILVGEQCGDDPNYKCNRGSFFATCECTNGYFQMEDKSTKCYCPHGMVDSNGKCSCATGYKQTPDGKCIQPQTSCPWGYQLKCYDETGQIDADDCIPVCDCIPDLKENGTCSASNAISQCIVQGRESRIEFKSVGSLCDKDKNFLCVKGKDNKPSCECVNGYEPRLLMGHPVSCKCPEPKKEIQGKCVCENKELKNGACTPKIIPNKPNNEKLVDKQATH